MGRLCRTWSAMLMIIAGLNVNVVTPANATPNSKLPVVVVRAPSGLLSHVLIVITHLTVDIWG